MRPIVSSALLLGLLAAGGSAFPQYQGTVEPSKQPPTASGPSAYDDEAAPAPSTPTAPPVSEPAPADAGPTASPQPAAGQGAAADFDVKSNFRNICSFCHSDYGRKAGRGPQLMDSPRTDQFLFDRIKHGLTGRMPGFGGTYSDAQIEQFVKFIRSLEPGETPKNPS